MNDTTQPEKTTIQRAIETLEGYNLNGFHSGLIHDLKALSTALTRKGEAERTIESVADELISKSNGLCGQIAADGSMSSGVSAWFVNKAEVIKSCVAALTPRPAQVEKIEGLADAIEWTASMFEGNTCRVPATQKAVLTVLQAARLYAAQTQDSGRNEGGEDV